MPFIERQDVARAEAVGEDDERPRSMDRTDVLWT
jgi:hypothetical protein